MPDHAENKAYGLALVVVFAMTWILVKGFGALLGVTV